MSKLALLAAVPFMVAPLAAPAPMATAPTGIKLTLEQVKEIRRKDYVKDASSSFGFDAPGLHLQFAMAAPKGRTIVEVRQPAEVRAVDASGLDLTRLAPSPFGEPKHVETIQEWQKPPHALTFRLALPRRSAASFTLTAKMEAVTYVGLRDATLPAGPEWKEVPAGTVGPAAARVRVQRQRGSLHLVFEPGSAKDHIETVVLRHGETTLERESTMWNDRQVTYMFTAPAEPGAVTTAITAQLKLRQGLGVIPITIDLKDEPLP